MNKTGRKATAVNEITDRNFTIVDLININTNVKAPTIRMHVKRSVVVSQVSYIHTTQLPLLPQPPLLNLLRLLQIKRY